MEGNRYNSIQIMKRIIKALSYITGFMAVSWKQCFHNRYKGFIHYFKLSKFNVINIIN